MPKVNEKPSASPAPTELSLALAGILAVDPPKAESPVNDESAKPAPATPEAKAPDAPATPEAKDTAVPAPTPAASTGSSELVAYLKEENASLKAQLKTNADEVANLQAEVTKLKAMDPDGLTVVVRETAKSLAVKLNNSCIGVEELSGKPLLSLVEKLSAEFVAKFKPGQKTVSANPASATPVPPPAQKTSATRLK